MAFENSSLIVGVTVALATFFSGRILLDLFRSRQASGQKKENKPRAEKFVWTRQGDGD
jgi:hypothetical protein